MPNKRKHQKPRRFNLVTEARAGLIPASDDIANERRIRTAYTARIIRTVKTHLGSVERVSDDQAVTDILADLRHYCDHKGLSFGKLNESARAQYLEDADETA